MTVGDWSFGKIKQVAGREGTWAEAGAFGLQPGEEEKAFQTKGTDLNGAPARTRQDRQDRVRACGRRWGGAGRAIAPARGPPADPRTLRPKQMGSEDISLTSEGWSNGCKNYWV